MNTQTQSFAADLINVFGEQLTAVYAYNCPSDAKLLLVTANNADMHQMRTAFREMGEELPVPVIVPQAIFARHLRLFPMLAEALHDGTCLLGDPVPLKQRPNGLPYWAQVMMESSAAVGNAAEIGRLRSAACRFLGREVGMEETAVSLLAAMQHRLKELMDSHNFPIWTPDQPAADPALPGLVASFSRLGVTVYVFDDSLPDLLDKMDAAAITAVLEQPKSGIELVTARQLRLLLLYESSAMFTLQNYTHTRGGNPLAGLSPKHPHIFRDAARKTAVIRTETFPRAYFTMPDGDEAIHILIHDFQNKLLNVQLEHELLYRLLRFDRFTMPELPPRTASPVLRVDAIFAQLDWWSAQYMKKMTE